MRRAALLLLLAACADSPQPAPPPVVVASASAPVPSASASASASASVHLDPPPPPAPVVAFAEFFVTGLEARLAADDLRVALPGVVECSKNAAGKTGWLNLSFTVFPDGKLSPPATGAPQSRIVGTLATCIQAAFAGIVIQGARQPKASISVWVSLGPPEPAGLAAFPAGHALRREDDGSCSAIEAVPDCPPHKMCEAPTRTRARCPSDHGLPAQPVETSAHRLVSASVFGGKTGQGGEEIRLYETAGACAAAKVRTQLAGAGDPLADPAGLETVERVDVPCAAFETAFALAKKHFATLRPKGEPKAIHGVHKEVSFASRAKPSAKLVATKASWFGPDPADAKFDGVASALSAAVAKRGKLTLSRLAP